MLPFTPVSAAFSSVPILEIDSWPGEGPIYGDTIDCVDFMPAIRRNSGVAGGMALFDGRFTDYRFFLDYCIVIEGGTWDGTANKTNMYLGIEHNPHVSPSGTIYQQTIIPLIGEPADIRYGPDAADVLRNQKCGTIRLRARWIRAWADFDGDEPTDFGLGVYLRVV